MKSIIPLFLAYFLFNSLLSTTHTSIQSITTPPSHQVCDTFQIPLIGIDTISNTCGIITDQDLIGYPSNSDGILAIITDSCVGSITLSFQEFAIEPGDFFTIYYDGSLFGRSITFFESSFVLPDPITSTRSKILIQFKPNNNFSLNRRFKIGFEANEQQPPIANFVIEDTLIATFDYFRIENTSSHAENIFWDFGDGETTPSPFFGHHYEEPGIYTITQISSNCLGSDTIQQKIEVRDKYDLEIGLQDTLHFTLQQGETVMDSIWLWNRGLETITFEVDSASQGYYKASDLMFYNDFFPSYSLHIFEPINPQLDHLLVDVSLKGDFEQASEKSELIIDSTAIAQIQDQNMEGVTSKESFDFSRPQLKKWLADEKLEIELQNTIDVEGPFQNNHRDGTHLVEISSNGFSWLALETQNGLVERADSTAVVFKLNAEDILEGTYYLDILLHTNDPNSPQQSALAPVKLTVIGAPIIETIDTLKFETAYIGFPTRDSFKIHNSGTADLAILNIKTSSSEFLPSFSPFTLAPRDAKYIPIDFQSFFFGITQETLTIQTNIGDTQLVLLGNTVQPPTLNYTPDSINITLLKDSAATIPIYLTNEGNNILDYELFDELDLLIFNNDSYEERELSNIKAIMATRSTSIHVTEITTENPADLEKALDGIEVLFFSKSKRCHRCYFGEFAPVIQDFVQRGGKVVFSFTGVGKPYVNLGLFEENTNGDTKSATFTILDETHPLLADTKAPFKAQDATAFVDFSNPDIVSIIQHEGSDVLAYRDIGVGKAIFIGYDYYLYDANAAQILLNAIHWESSASALPEWISINDFSGAIPNQDIDSSEVAIDATGLYGGIYNSTIFLESNDPTRILDSIPVRLTVIAPPEITFSNSEVTCNGLVNFKDESLNIPTTWIWDFGDGNTSTEQDPSNIYQDGDYTVTLIACNDWGCDTLVQESLITVDYGASFCETISLSYSDTLLINEPCTGVIYDFGGPDSSYEINSTGTITIHIPDAATISLTFEEFDLDFSDEIFIYDGPNSSAPLMAIYHGFSPPVLNRPIITTFNALTLVMKTSRFPYNPDFLPAGFKATWQCNEEAPVANLTAIKTFSCSGQVDLIDESTGSPTSWLWDFGDGNTSNEQLPTHFYAQNGIYPISLIACNSHGCDTILKENFIEIDLNGNFCDRVFMPTDGSTITNIACTGIISDDNKGDRIDYYSNNAKGIFTIQPPDATSIELTFLSFRLEDCCDWLRLYDGPDTNAPLIGWFNGTSIRNGEVFKSSGGALTLEMSSDASINEAGFLASWACNSRLPTAAFRVNQTVSCSGNLTFIDESIGVPTSWYWNFGDGTTSIESTPYHSYNTEGFYDISLKICNEQGCDSLTQTSFVAIDFQKAYCDTISMPIDDKIQIINACTGILRDYGGANDYTYDKTNGLTVIQVPDAAFIALDFRSFDLFPNVDFLNIYDGTNTDAPLIGAFTGTDLPNGGLIKSTNGTIAIQMITDFSNPASGFELAWTCNNGLPIADFTSNQTFSCAGTITFEDQSTGIVKSRKWDFGDGTSSTETQPIHSYQTNGTYTVSLVACSDSGCDTLVQPDFIIIDKQSSFCDTVLLSANSSTQIINACSGVLFDSGGPNQAYPFGFNVESGLIIQVPNADNIVLNFKSFALDDNDSLKIYSGLEDTSNLVGVYRGHNLPNNGMLIIPSGTVKIVMYIRSHEETEGFEMTWSCNKEAPIADFLIHQTNTCSGSLSFEDLSSGVTNSWFWDFGDGTISTEKNPTHSYQQNGLYAVQLIACNDVACDTLPKSDLVNVNLGSDFCDTLWMPTDAKLQIINACSGVLFDNGGPNNNSLANVPNSLISIQPTDAQGIKLTFRSFDLSDNSSLNIYDGADNTAPLIGSFSGSILPNNGVIISTNSAITLEMSKSFYGDTDAGFELIWACTEMSPTTDFAVNQTTSCSGVVNFKDQSLGFPDSWHWDFGDGASSTDSMPIHHYKNAGSYAVALATCNNIACDTLTKMNYVTVDFQAPFCDTLQMPVNEQTQIINACTGVLFDNGGPNGNYATGPSKGTTILQIPEATAIQLVFHSFNLSKYGDTLFIYDGPNKNAPLIGAYTGENLPEGGFISSSTGSLAFLMITNNFANPSGFEIEWACNMMPPIADFSLSQPFNCYGTSTFIDKTKGFEISRVWDFGDGITSIDKHPTHAYAQAGEYDVSLVVCNEVACDTSIQTQFVKAENTFFCDTISMPTNSIPQTVYECTGILKSGAQKENEQSDILVISPPGATQIRIDVNFFNLDNWVNFYDGPTTDAPILGSFIGNIAPNAKTIISSSGVITIERRRDFSREDIGFELTWSCNTDSPISDFKINPPTTCSSLVTFRDQSKGIPSSRFWDFGDGNTSTDLFPNHIYQNNGVFDISLAVCNNLGCDTSMQQIIINKVNDFCDTISMTNNYEDRIITACEGQLIDEGFEDTLAPTSSWTTIISPPGTFIELQLDKTDASSAHLLTIYDGQDSQGSYLGNFSEFGETAQSIISSNNAMTIELRRELQSFNTGFELSWECKPSIPIAHFTAPTPFWCGNRVNFLNASIKATKFHWEFGDGASSNADSPTYFYQQPGIYEVLLIASNEVYVDSFSQIIIIEDGIITADISMPDTVFTNQIVDFQGISNQAVSWQWNFDSVLLADNIPNPSFSFSESGLYEINLKVATDRGCPNSILKHLVVVDSVGNSLKGVANQKNSNQKNIASTDLTYKIFPNPTKNLIRINLKNMPFGKTGVVQLYDTNGKHLLSKRIDAKDNITQMDLSNFSAGIYFLRITIGENTFLERIIRQ